jgi:hypothetical protein
MEMQLPRKDTNGVKSLAVTVIAIAFFPEVGPQLLIQLGFPPDGAHG